MHYCPNCGNPVGDTEKFCQNCGVRIEVPQAAPAQPTEQPTYTQPTYTQPVYAQPDAPAPKKSHKTLWIVLTVVAVLLVAAAIGLLLWKPWNSCSGNGAGSSVSAEEALKSAVEKNQDIRSEHVEMTMNYDIEIGIAGYTQNMEVKMDVSGDTQKDPERAILEMTVSMMGQKQSVQVYTEEGRSWASTNGGRTWSSADVAGAGNIGLSDPTQTMEAWMKNAKNFKQKGTETLNGEKVTVYSCMLGAEYFKDVMSMSGQNPMESLGLDMDEILDGIADMPVTFSINGDGRLVRLTVDVRDTMKALMAKAMESAMGGQKIDVDIDIDEATIEIVLSQFNAIDPITRPSGIN